MGARRRREEALHAAPGPRRRRVGRSRAGEPPGTLKPPEGVAGQAPRISVIAYGPDAHVERTVERVEDALAEVGPGRVAWINVEGLGPPGGRALRRFHPDRAADGAGGPGGR